MLRMKYEILVLFKVMSQVRCQNNKLSIPGLSACFHQNSVCCLQCISVTVATLWKLPEQISILSNFGVNHYSDSFSKKKKKRRRRRRRKVSSILQFTDFLFFILNCLLLPKGALGKLTVLGIPQIYKPVQWHESTQNDNNIFQGGFLQVLKNFC